MLFGGFLVLPGPKCSKPQECRCVTACCNANAALFAWSGVAQDQTNERKWSGVLLRFIFESKKGYSLCSTYWPLLSDQALRTPRKAPPNSPNCTWWKFSCRVGSHGEVFHVHDALILSVTWLYRLTRDENSNVSPGTWCGQLLRQLLRAYNQSSIRFFCLDRLTFPRTVAWLTS